MNTRPFPSGPDGFTEAAEVKALRVAPAPRPTLRLHLWLENKGELFFGIGRAQLLFSIQQQGSLRQAAKALGMSYRAAWGKIQQTEQALGLKLVESKGQRRDGVSLTPEGEELADQFQAWFTTVERCALNSASTIFPFPVAKCSETDT
ncbi:MAG: LysR family transcriptional regulator [Humidesulfovibrio sp.]|nr:LysR family transcriptional regulator [Humidesulfovibrio sp.]